MNQFSPAAKIFIALTVLAGAALLLYGLVHSQPASLPEFFVFLVLAVVASRLTVKLPGVHGTMSVNLPFFLIAAIKLSFSEALVIACVGAMAQSFGRSHGNRPVQIAFNAATLTNSIALAAWAAAAVQRQFALPAASVAAGAAYFLGNTILMMLVLWLAEGEHPLPTWGRMAELAFPYYLLSAAIAAIICGGAKSAGWTLALIVLVAMYLTYRSYRVYFARAGAEATGMAKSAGT